jgi:hypothetical protein
MAAVIMPNAVNATAVRLTIIAMPPAELLSIR